jgi:tetratricopeptide (TPR) repeat protein
VSGFAFVSHSSRDADYVRRLADHLRLAGVATVAAGAGPRDGDEPVTTCAALIVVMTPAAEAAPQVAGEIDRARRAGRPILPLLLAGEPFFALGGLYSADVRGDALPEHAFVQLLRDLLAGSAVEATGPAPGWPGQIVLGDLPAAAPAWRDRPGPAAGLANAAQEQRTAVVGGAGGARGMGKTQVAAAYARMRVRQGWPVVVWAAAGTEDGIVTALDELATAAGVRDPAADRRHAAREGLRWLAAQPGPCLMVLDDARDADLVRRWTPADSPVQTVVTTARPDLAVLGDPVAVGPFETGEAIAYLAGRTGLDDPDGAERLAEVLGGLPLALALVSAIIGPGRRYPGYYSCLSSLQDDELGGLLPRQPEEPCPPGTGEAILLAVEELDGTARRLLEHLAVLAPTGAGLALTQLLAGADDLDELAAGLTERALSVPAAGTDRLTVHPLVLAVLRYHSWCAGSLDERVLTAAEAVATAAARTGGRWTERSPLIDLAGQATALAGHATGDRARRLVLAVRAELMLELRTARDSATTVGFGAALVADQELIFGPDHPDVLRSRHNLANAYQEAGRLPVAIALHQRNAADFTRLLGPAHPDTFASRHNLANTYQQAGRLDEAVKLHERNLDDQLRTRGAEHPGTLHTRHNLGIAYHAAGRLGEAIRRHEENLLVRVRVLGADHPDTMGSRHELALTYHEAGRADRAAGLHERNLRDRQRALGADHPDTLRSRHGLALAHLALRRPDRAIPLLERIVADGDRLLGGTHPDTISARNSLANAYLHAGRPVEAIALHERNIDDQRRLLGPEHPGVVVTCANLAGAYESAGRAADAVELCRWVLAEQDALGRGGRPEVARLRGRLERTLSRSG